MIIYIRIYIYMHIYIYMYVCIYENVKYSLIKKHLHIHQNQLNIVYSHRSYIYKSIDTK